LWEQAIDPKTRQRILQILSQAAAKASLKMPLHKEVSDE
jgi:hypothetical protein